MRRFFSDSFGSLAGVMLSSVVFYGAFSIPAATSPLSIDEKRTHACAYAGTFVFVGGDKETKAWQQAIDQAVEQFNLLLQPIARSRLEDAGWIPPRYTMTCLDEAIQIEAHPKKPSITPFDGTAGKGQHDGDHVEMRIDVKPHRLFHSARTETGGRSTVFKLSNDGKTLTAHITVESKQLSAPLHFVATYQRQ